MAIALLVVRVMEVVLVCELFASGDVTNGAQEDSLVFFFGFAVRLATVI